MADSWLIDGNCENCRRNNYCKKPCTKAKRNHKNMLYGAVMRATGMDKVLCAMGPEVMKNFDDMARYNGMKY